MRAAMIFAGGAMLERFHWLIYIFGAFLVLTGLKLLRQTSADAPDPQKGWFMRLMRRTIPSTTSYSDDKFFVKESGKWLATPLFMALLLVEVTDVIRARLDTAIFAITRDPFIVFTSNICDSVCVALLPLAGVMDRLSTSR
jgi:tellurite resistance protein TerC